MRPDRSRLSLPIQQWPAIDQGLWSDGLRGGGLFDVAGAGAHWSAASRRKTAGGYGRWLHWLEMTGQCDHAVPPGRRVTRDRAAAYIRHLDETLSPGTLLCRVQELADALRVLAPGDDRHWLMDLYRAVASRARPVRDKRQRLRTAGELVALGERLMTSAETTMGWSRRRRAVQYRDGLMIALLAYRPVQRRISPRCNSASTSWNSVVATGCCSPPPRPKIVLRIRRRSRRRWKPIYAIISNAVVLSWSLGDTAD